MSAPKALLFDIFTIVFPMKPTIVLVLALAVSAAGAWADRYRDCRQSQDLDLRIHACTLFIKRGIQESQVRRAIAHHNRGLAYAEKGKVDLAIADYNEAIALDPQLAEARLDRGVAYEKKGEYTRAIANYTEAIEMKPDNFRALNNRAWSYLKLGKPELGLPDAERAVELSPDDPDYLDTRGQIYAALGRLEEAITDLRKAVAIDPSHKEARKALTRLGVPLEPLSIELQPGIIGKDDREIIDKEGSPWSAIGQVNTGGYRMYGQCTGSLIASNLVVTAAHCVMDHWKREPWPLHDIHFLAGVKRDKRLGHSTAKCLYFAPGYEYIGPPRIYPTVPVQRVPWRSFFRDIVLIVLKDSLEDIPPLKIERANELPPYIKLLHAAYPGERRHMLSGHFGCRLLQTDERLWYTDCDSHAGSSGGPIFIQGQDELTLAAIHLGAAFDGMRYSIALPIGEWIDDPAKRKCP